MRPGLVTLKVNFTYFASVGPIFIFVAFAVRSCFAIWCHCELAVASLEFEVEIVTMPALPSFKNEIMSKFWIFESERTSSLFPSGNV